VRPFGIRHIGKETNRWEEQFYLGSNEKADIDYGTATDDAESFRHQLRVLVTATGQRKVARQSGVSRQTVERFVKGEKIQKTIVVKLSES
jgi:hypothetical protein